MEPVTAYMLLGAVSTFGIGWKRISSSYKALFGASPNPEDVFHLKTGAAEVLAWKIRKAANPLLTGPANFADPANVELVTAIKDMMARHKAPEAHWFDEAKEYFKALALPVALLFCYMAVIPAAVNLKPGDPDIPTLLAARGAIIGIWVGMAICVIYKGIEHKVRR